jgi:hypothetical protein
MIDIQEVEFEGRPIVVAEVTELATTAKPCIVTKEGAGYLLAPVENSSRGDLNNRAVEAFIAAVRDSRTKFADLRR